MSFTLPFTPAEITAFKDIALGLSAIATGSAAVATATFAYKGLNRWKDETAFKAKFELAMEVVETAYKINNAIFSLRRTAYGLGGKSGIDSIRSTKLVNLTDLYNHYQTLSVQVKAILAQEEYNAVLVFAEAPDFMIQKVDEILYYQEEYIHYSAELDAREQDVDSGHIVSEDLLKRLISDAKSHHSAFLELADNIRLTYTDEKSKHEIQLTNLIDTGLSKVVDSMNIYLKSR